MSIFDLGKMCTFSAISGTITQNGKPVAHAKVIRETDYNSKKQDETPTDKHGYFEMPALFERSVGKYLPRSLWWGSRSMSS